MNVTLEPVMWLRSLLSGSGPPSGSTFCATKNVTYHDRFDNPEGWNWCLVPEGGYDAVFFAGLAIAVMCLASPRWDALIVLFFGGIYFTFSYYWNLEHVSNAVMLWLGMRPADIFVYVFLPPFLLDLSVRIDFFILKKVAFNIAFMAFVMVAASALLLIPFMLYALDLKASGWSAGHVALFGSMIASTDAASVSAVLRSGGGPEILSVLLEGESLFNDASSLTLFEIFKEVVLESATTTLAHDLQGIVVMTIWSTFVGICIGLAMGIFTRWVYVWLQHRNMEAMAEVAWSVAGAYLSFYITQVWCKGSGCIGAVAFGLYGSSTMLWGMSTKARLTGIFTQFWSVLTFLINGLIFFYVGASSVNFTIRSSQTLYVDSGGSQLAKILLYKLPLIYLVSFSMRFILIFVSFKLLQLARLSEGLTIQQVIFVTVGGLRGSLSLVLAQSAATMASSHEEDRRVKAEIAIYTAGYVIMTLLINAPLCGVLLTVLGLDKVRQEQLAMRGEVKNLFRKFTSTAIEDLSAGQDEDELLQGLDWAMLKLHTDFDKQLDKELPEMQPRVVFSCGGWLRSLTAPMRLWRYLVACFRCTPDAVELDQSEEALTRVRQDAELKRATNLNVRELQSRAPGASSMPFSAPPARPPTALIIREQTVSAGSGLAAANSYPPGANGARRPPAAVNPSGLRRSASHRLSTLVVAPPGAGGDRDREPSVHGRTFARSSSRFLEGAVAGPAMARMTSLQQRPSPNGGPLALPSTELPGGAPLDSATDGGGGGGGEPQIQVLLSPSPGEQQEQQQPGGGEGEGNGLVDPQLLALADAEEGGGGPSEAELAVGGGTTGVSEPTRPSPRIPASAVSRPSPLSRGTVGGGSGPLSRLHASSSLPKLHGLDEQQPEAGPQVDEGAAGGVVSEPEPEPTRAAAAPPPLAPDRALLQSVLVIRPGASSRDPTQPQASLNHNSTVRLVQRLGDEEGRGSGLETMRTDTMAGGSRGLGRSSARMAAHPAAAAAAAAAQQQQMFDFQQPPTAESLDGSMINWAAKDRPLGRKSLSAPDAARPLGRASAALLARLDDGNVRSAGSEPPSLSPFEFAMPEDMAAGASITEPFRAGFRAGSGGDGGGGGGLNRSSVRQGDGALGPPSVRTNGLADGGLGRSSVRPGGAVADGGGGLSRGSVRQGAAAGGGGLARGSMRLGRQGGLAAVSTQLARIYDTDGGAFAAAADGASQFIGRKSISLEPPRAASTYDSRQQSSAGGLPPPPSSPSLKPPPGAGGAYGSAPTSNHIALQVANLQQREAVARQQQQQLDAQNQGQGTGQQHAQYSLGSSSKGVLMSLIRRSASHARSYTSGSGVVVVGGVGGAPAPGGRDLSGRGSEYNSLARRTRFADTNTAAALARASASGAIRQQSSEIDAGGSAGMCDPLLVEYRLRLLTGLKQYYRQKHAAGSLSPSSYKVLSYIADQSAHQPEHALTLWTMAKREISSGPLIDAEVAVYFRLKQWTAAAKSSTVTLVRKVIPRLLVPFVRLISSHTSAATLRGLETAVELWASLTQSLQTEWLQYSGVYGERLLEEVQHEADGAWSYIIERRIESPKKFGAVQTHRAVIDVLTQQQAFVREMNEGGMIEESECRKIVEMVEKRLQLLARRGPRWRQPTVMEILMGTAVLRGVSPRVVEWIRKNSTFRVYPQGAAIWDMGRKLAGAEPDGLIIVIRGVVRMMLQQEDALVPYYLGAGGVGGLVCCVLEAHVPGMSSAAAYAEGNALGKGPLVMHVPWSVLQVLRRFSREERLAPYQALDLQMYRTAAVYVLDLLRQQVTQQFSAFIRSSLLTILSSQRLDGPTVRRQRIRLLLQPAATDHIVDGAIDWIGELLSCDPEIVRMLLENTANPAAASAGAAGSNFHHHNHHYNHHSHSHSLNHLGGAGHAGNHHHHLGYGSAGGGSGSGHGAGGADAAAPVPAPAQVQAQHLAVQRIAASPWVEVMYKAIAAATGAVMDMIRSSLKDSILVVLGPRQGIVQRTTMVLIQGSLEPAPIADADGTGGTGGAGGPFVASNNELHVAPSVMVWVSDYFEGELVAQKELRVVAGPRGATLLLWGVKPEDLLLPSPAAEPVGGAPPAAAAGADAPGSGGGLGKAEAEPSRLMEPARGILSVAKSMAMRARQENFIKVKPEVAAAANAAAAANKAAAAVMAAGGGGGGGGAAVNGDGSGGAVNGGAGAGGPKEGGEGGAVRAPEANGTGESKPAKMADERPSSARPENGA